MVDFHGIRGRGRHTREREAVISRSLGYVAEVKSFRDWVRDSQIELVPFFFTETGLPWRQPWKHR